MTNAFLIIDAQYDFCDPDGALFVPGAEQDVDRIATLIKQHADQIDHIVVTLDTHHVLDIAHPLFWQDYSGKHPAPFTQITGADIDAGRWIARFSTEKAKQYVHDLEADGQFTHFIWPEHCLVGSRGAALHDSLFDALKGWSSQRDLDYVAVQKGLYPLSEHFGIFRAQVPDPAIPETQLNTALIADLVRFDNVYLMGEAKSHCVANSLKQLLDFAPELVPKLVVVTDCMSDVTGLGYLADSIYAEAQARNVRFVESGGVFN
ncbi:isochorismatase family protein [Spirosoma sp. KCTC 42546]|uniref:isochorismatase family protein n=1 Tax=Spirosoma sp. KCTC 42546 TaxID=2520506 RepID=UPI00115A82AB|nr:isochorismatase family protein [Spirosoma sp. KCTC 42546]QDK83388.1 isochorismatase family protein [Spirosoma sp. KCTC 42546]